MAHDGHLNMTWQVIGKSERAGVDLSGVLKDV
jgi:hypothetical protein